MNKGDRYQYTPYKNFISEWVYGPNQHILVAVPKEGPGSSYVESIGKPFSWNLMSVVFHKLSGQEAE